MEEGSTDTNTFIATYHEISCPGDYSIQFQGVNGSYGISIVSYDRERAAVCHPSCDLRLGDTATAYALSLAHNI